MSVLKIENLKVFYQKSNFFGRNKKVLKAVNDVSFELNENEIIGLVGESGCGKSSLGRAVVRLERAHGGKIFLGDTDILSLRGSKLRKFRKNIQFIFQDPYSSLNPRMRVGEILEEVLLIHTKLDKSERIARIGELLKQVGMPESACDRYPHQFSGGQRQRIGIARALAVEPKVIIADEPVSALDVSVQSQIVNLLSDIRKNSNTSFLFIAHDLAVVEHISDRIIVMYLGKIVEMGEAREVCQNPQHPYTKALLSAVPEISFEKKERIMLKSEMPSPYSDIKGCNFYSRCPMRQESCKSSEIELFETAENSKHYSSCIFNKEVENL